MTSWLPYLCPKTTTRRPCWCPKPVPWELNSFLMQTLSFVTINLHLHWSRELKHSIVGYPIWDNPLYRSAQLRSVTDFVFRVNRSTIRYISCRHKSYPGNCRHNPNPDSRFATPTPTPQGGGYRISSHDHGSHPLVTEDHRWTTLWSSEASPVPTSTEIPSITNNSPERNATPCVCQSESSYT